MREFLGELTFPDARNTIKHLLTFDAFNLYLSTPNLSTALQKPKTLEVIQDCFLQVILERRQIHTADNSCHASV